MVHLVICEKDNNELIRLTVMTKELFENYCCIYECSNYFMLQTLLFDEIKERIDILIMNIQIDGVLGINLANQIQSVFPNIQIAFISEHAELSRYIFRANPSYFLLQPIEENDLKDALNRMVTQIKKKKNRILVFETKKGICPLLIENILYIESEKRMLHIYLSDNRVESGYEKLDVIENSLPEQFIRCHQSYLVNMNKILYFTKTNIYLENEATVPVSRPKYKEVKEKVLQFLNSDERSVRRAGAEV